MQRGKFHWQGRHTRSWINCRRGRARGEYNFRWTPHSLSQPPRKIKEYIFVRLCARLLTTRHLYVCCEGVQEPFYVILYDVLSPPRLSRLTSYMLWSCAAEASFNAHEHAVSEAVGRVWIAPSPGIVTGASTIRTPS